MDYPEECSVCFTAFDENEQRPCNLPCGHTFCSLCIDDMMDGGQLSCPGCRTSHPATCITQFPISYCTEALVRKLKSMELTQTSAGVTTAGGGATGQKHSSSISRKLQTQLEEQKNKVNNLVTDSQEVQSQLDLYRAQINDWKSQHLNLLDRLNVLVKMNKTALDRLRQEDTRVLEMKKEGEKGVKQLEAVQGCLHAVNTAQEVVPAVGYAEYYNKEVEDWMQKCQEQIPDINIITTSRNVWRATSLDLEFIVEETGVSCSPVPQLDPASTMMEKIRKIITPPEMLRFDEVSKMRPPIKRLVEAGQVYGVQDAPDHLRSSKMTFTNGQLYLHCLLDQPPPAHASILPVKAVVENLDPSSALVFLELTWSGSTRGRVHIRLRPDTPLARQFFLLCTGQRGSSYRNTALLGVWNKGKAGERVWGGDYQQNNGKGGTPLLSHLQGEYRESGKSGMVWPVWGPESDKSAQFSITTRDRDDSRKHPWVFGEVESGLEVIRSAINCSDIRQVIIVDCGIVVPL